MRSAFFRFLLCSFVSCAVLFSVSAALLAADPAPKADESGWILPEEKNAGTGWHIRLKDARAEAAKDGGGPQSAPAFASQKIAVPSEEREARKTGEGCSEV